MDNMLIKRLRAVFLVILIVASGSLSATSKPADLLVKSPNGELVVVLSLQDGQPFYSVRNRGAALVEPSLLGLNVAGGDYGPEHEFLAKPDNSRLGLNVAGDHHIQIAGFGKLALVSHARQSRDESWDAV